MLARLQAVPPCANVSQASSTSCVVVPCVTQGTLCQSDTPQVSVWAGQVVNLQPQDTQAFQQNLQAAAGSSSGAVVSAAPNSGTVSNATPGANELDTAGANEPRNADDVSFGGGWDQQTSLLVIGIGAVLLFGLMRGR